MPTLPIDLPECLVFLLGKAYQKAHADFKARIQPYGLTNMQHLVLEGLWYRQGMTATELGRCLILDKATLSGVLDRMEAAGWIEKRPDPEDRRQMRLYTTKKADALKDELIRERREANEELLADFTTEERVLLKRLLRDLIG
ncbi:DNA-binding transcriptional regulator, MarR family [Desulfacinum hydrothermale DSM 13146]|uniref:DNA-binding transcriptional regulator, MarR family n=1 Tax=Desulfacinum hydrothermale DSM 13146 TaxID=1121390 RepID=A0A1W1X9Q0_9BACT|nr:MarR family transcriptional regulator [Desulfacinum hydrothermale]SMC20619.1 DNA-binding transcriptional regulator, MarR family [Desulfacinum hydrothermale DSM 13146]